MTDTPLSSKSVTPVPHCERCDCVLVVQPDETFWCANCGDAEVETQPVVWKAAR